MSDVRFQYLHEAIELHRKRAEELETMLADTMRSIEKSGHIPVKVMEWWKVKKAEEEERLRKETEQRRKVMEQKRIDLEKERGGLTRRLEYVEQELAKCTQETPSGS